MTDNEIKKALECCNGYDCENCKVLKYCDYMHPGALARASLDLINRQKAENESLKMDLAKCSIRLDNLYKTADEIKSEAIKEFAERLKENYCFTDRWGKIIPKSTVDDLVKEMTEVETNQRKEDEGK